MGELWAKTPASLIFDATWTLTDVRVYLYLDFRAGSRGWYRTSQPVIAEDLGIGLRSVEKAVPRLRDAGLLTTQRKGNRAGEITYGIVARVPHETAVPLDADPHADAGRFRRLRRNRRNASSLQRPQTSTPDYDQVVRRSWP